MRGGVARTQKAKKAQARAQARQVAPKKVENTTKAIGMPNPAQPTQLETEVVANNALGAPNANAEHPEIRESVPGSNVWEKVSLRNNPVVSWWENKETKEQQWNPPGAAENHPILYTKRNTLPEGWQEAHHRNNKNRKTIWYEYGVNSNNDSVRKTAWNLPNVMANANNGLGNNPLNAIQVNANKNVVKNNGLGNNPLSAIQVNNAVAKANNMAAKANEKANNELGNNPLSAIQVNAANNKANKAAGEATAVANVAAAAANAVNNAAAAVVNAANSGNKGAITTAKNAVAAGNNAFKGVMNKITSLKTTLKNLEKSLNTKNTSAAAAAGGARRRRNSLRKTRRSRRN